MYNWLRSVDLNQLIVLVLYFAHLRLFNSWTNILPGRSSPHWPFIRSLVSSSDMHKSHNIHKKRWQQSIKEIFMTMEITLSTTGNPAGVPAGLKAASEIRRSKSAMCIILLMTTREKKAPPSLRLEREVETGSIVMHIKQCSVSPAAGCDSAVIKRDLWEADGWSWSLNAEWGMAGIIYSQLPNILPLPPERSPFPCPPIGRLIILSLRQWPNLHVILWAGNVEKKRAPAVVQIGHTGSYSLNERTTMLNVKCIISRETVIRTSFCCC